MEEIKYAYYGQCGNNIHTMEDFVQYGDLKKIRVAEFSQEYGDDISVHGAPMYETITHLKDIETEKEVVIRSRDLFKKNIIFVPVENAEQTIENSIRIMETKIDSLKKELQYLEERKDFLERNQEEIFPLFAQMQNKEKIAQRIETEELPFETSLDSASKTQEPIKTKDIEPKTKETKTEGKNKKFYVTFSKKQIARIYDHTEKKDFDGKPLKVANIYIPTVDYRHLKFGKDSNGIDRDSRKAYWTTIFAKIKKEKGIDDEQNGGIKRFVYLDSKNPDAKHYTIHFNSEMNEKTGEWDKPESVVLSSRELMQMYTDQRAIAKEKQKLVSHKKQIKNPDLGQKR